MNEYVRQYFTADYWLTLGRDFWHALHTRKFYKELVVMTLGMCIGAASVYYFLMPGHLIVLYKSDINSCLLFKLLGIETLEEIPAFITKHLGFNDKHPCYTSLCYVNH